MVVDNFLCWCLLLAADGPFTIIHQQLKEGFGYGRDEWVISIKAADWNLSELRGERDTKLCRMRFKSS